MKPFLLLLPWCVSAFGTLSAQEPVFLGQRLLIHYNQWQGSQGSADNTRATYDFNLGMPVLTYRLGALALTGDLDYERLSNAGQSGASLGLNRYGMKMALFPYRPLHFTFDYSRTQTPGIAGEERASGNTFGVGLNYRGRKVQDVEVSLRRGNLSAGGARSDWSLWQVIARQDTKKTRISLEASRGELGTSDGGPRWQNSNVFASTDTAITQSWSLRSNLHLADGAGSRTLTTDLNLTGASTGWTSISDLYLSQSRGDTSGSRSEVASQSIAMNKERWSAFSSAALSLSQIQGGEGNSNQAVLLLGGVYNLGRAWRVSADVGQGFGNSVSAAAATDGGSSGAASPKNLRTIHLGISEGGDVPGIIRRTLFFLSDQSFQNRIASEYPPGYVPSELATEMAQRRIRQAGNFSFAGDLWREQSQGGGELSNWARLTGQLRLNEGLTFLVIGDWKQDDGMAIPGKRLDSRGLTLNGSFSFGASQVIANAGYSRYGQSALPGDSALLSPPVLNPDATSRFLSTGFNSRFWLIPYGVQWARYESTSQPPTRAFMGFFLLNFRQVNMRVTYQSTSLASGLRDRRITVDLLRWMDTIAFGGGRP